jgi:tousled-like kinase
VTYGFCCSVQGSSHSDKEVDPNTPEKVPRTPSERKRKRKADDSSGAPGKGVRNATSDKKINDYFKHSGNSPIRHGGAKSPSPQQPYPMVRKPSRFLDFPFPFYKNKCPLP